VLGRPLPLFGGAQAFDEERALADIALERRLELDRQEGPLLLLLGRLVGD
jgi:hypothetical protein